MSHAASGEASLATWNKSSDDQLVKLTTALAAACAMTLASMAEPTAALANDDAKIDARIAAWATACKNRVATQYPKSIMADISVELGATLKQSIDAGQTTLKDIQAQGLSYNWSYKKHLGYCNTDGQGNVTEFVKGR